MQHPMATLGQLRVRKFQQVLFGLCWLLLLTPAYGQSAVDWYPYDQAVDLAVEEHKLLMVVQGPDDVSLTREQCAAAESMQQTAFSDQRLRGFYGFRVVATYRPTGPPQFPTSTKRRQPQPTTQPSHANVITYFCAVTPAKSVHVVHFVVGFPAPTWLTSECDWAFAEYTALDVGALEDRKTHMAAQHRQHLITLGEGVPTLNHRPALPDALQMAARLRDARLLTRFGTGWTPAERIKLIGSLRPHAELQAAISHQVLSLHPLVKLSVLEPIAFPILTKQSYWPPPTNRSLLASWFQVQRAKKRPLLIVLSATNAPASRQDDGFGPRVWQPKRDSVRQQLRRFDTIEVNRTELICLLRDAKLSVPDEATFRELRFLILGRSGTDIAWLVDEDELKLYRMLERASHGA